MAIPAWRYRWAEKVLYSYEGILEDINGKRQDIIFRTPYRELVPGKGFITDPTGRKAVDLDADKELRGLLQLQSAVQGALSALTERHREVFVLHYTHQHDRAWERIGITAKRFKRLRMELVMEVAKKLR